ncbi:MAG: hypothetical protein M0005_07950 [Actinomycetota bacterium]|jgi:hypothetical protein|nr:hypothetical protein [Actinomycetota bacterium]
MSFLVETKDCTALSDGELAEMADIVADGPAGLDIGVLSKQRDEWVLITQVRGDAQLQGFSFCTLERIGGTPCVLWGLVSVRRSPERAAVLEALRAEQFGKAVLAFPDEDVLVATKLREPGGFSAFAGLEDICPRPGYKVSGEERAWSRRLAKRFGVEGRVDDRTFVVKGDGSPFPVLDYEPEDLSVVDPEVSELMACLDRKRHDVLIAFGWAMAEKLASGFSA